MPQRILVPLDGSKLSEAILEWIEPIAHFEGGTRVHLLKGSLPVRLAPHSQEDRADTDYLQRLQLALGRKGVHVETHRSIGDPTAVILDHVGKLRPTLVAMSTHGDGGLARWVRGSVAQRVLRRCPVPLLLCNPKTKPPASRGGFGRILVPLDGSERSAEVLPAVEALARAHGSKVTLLHVSGEEILSEDRPQFPCVPDRREFEEDLEAPLARLERAGLKAEVVVVFAENAAAAILDYAEDPGADLVAMSTHGESGLPAWIFGSVADKVLRCCRAPVLVKRTAPLPAALSNPLEE